MRIINFLREFKEDPLLSIIDFLTRYFGGKKQFLPNSDELENKDVAELLERLKGVSEKETLSNLLEWQEKNISFWIDRMYYFLILYFLLIVSVYFFPLNYVTKNILALTLILMGVVNFIFTISYGMTLIIAILLFVVWIFSVNPLQAQKFYPVVQLVTLSLIFGAFLALVGYLILKYSALKSRIPGFKLKDTFKISLEVNIILKYKLAVCKDYAKLTAVLLYNLFLNNPIYFILIPRHVAAGIEINGKMYILDQKLPVTTLDGWLRVWNRKIATIYQLKISESNGKKKLELEKRGIAKLTNPSAHINTEKLTEEVARLIGINQVIQDGRTIVKIPLLSKLAKSYEDDEIVIYSMARTIKLRLENELCSSFENIEKIEIKQSDSNLIVLAYLRQV